MRGGWYEVTQIRIPELSGEVKVRNMIRWSIFSRFNVRAPPPESDLIELYLREKIFLALVDLCTGYQRADSQGGDPQHRLWFLRNLVDDDVGGILREGCFHEEVVFDACPTVSSDPPTLRAESGREVSLSGLYDRK